MSIMRVVKNKDNPYVMMNKTSIEDANISYKAKGLLAYILSKPDDWVIRVPDLIKHSTDGERAVYSGIKELRQAGYMVKRQYKNPKNNQIYWVEEVYETPNNEAIEVFQKQQEKLIVINEKRRTTLMAKKEEKEAEIPYSQNSEMDSQSKSNFVDNVDSVDKSEKKPYGQNSDMGKKDENSPNNSQFPYSGFEDIQNEDLQNEDIQNSELLLSNDLPNNDLLINDSNKKGKEKAPSSFSPNQLWNKALELIRVTPNMTDVSFNTWFSGLELKYYTKDRVILEACNTFTADILQQRFVPVIENSIKSVLGYKPDIEIQVKKAV